MTIVPTIYGRHKELLKNIIAPCITPGVALLQVSGIITLISREYYRIQLLLQYYYTR